MRVGLLLSVMLALGLSSARADDPPAWRADDVARVDGTRVTWDDLCAAAADAALPRLQDAGSLEHWAFLARVGDRLLGPLCQKHGVTVTDTDVDARWKAADEQARRRTGVGLIEDLESRSRPVWTKRAELRRQLQVQGLEAKGVSVEEALAAANIRTAVPADDRMKVEALPAGVVATVDGVPLPAVELGATLLAYGGARQARELVERACRIALADAEGARLEATAMDAELAHLARLAPLESQFDAEEVWEKLRVRGGVEQKERHTHGWFRNSPYAQSLFGIVKRFRDAATAGEVEAVWHRESATTFGAHILVQDIEISFRSRGDVFATGPKRTRAEALRMIREIRAQHARGESFDDILRRFQEAQAPGIRAERRRLYATNQNRILFDAARALEDKAVSRPIETLSEVHVLRRERAVPAPDFEAIEPVVRERLARQRTRLWLEKNVADRGRVQVRWPLPQLR